MVLPIVAQPKPKFATTEPEDLEPKMIRASIDIRVPNQTMKRSRYVQAPIVKDFTYTLRDSANWIFYNPTTSWLWIQNQVALQPSTHRGEISNPLD